MENESDLSRSLSEIAETPPPPPPPPPSPRQWRHHERQNQRLCGLALDAFRRRLQMLCATADAYRESVKLFRVALKHTYDDEIRLLGLFERSRRADAENDRRDSTRWINDLLKSSKERAVRHLSGVSAALKQVGQVTELLLAVFRDYLLKDLRLCPLGREVALEFERVAAYHDVNRRIVEEVAWAVSESDRHFYQSYLFSVRELGQLLVAASHYKLKYLDQGYDALDRF